MDSIWIYIIVGFVAQIIDGALGMAYGVFSNSLLLAFGIPPAVSSASVHFAETFTTLISGVSHFKLGNVDKSLFKNLVVAGVIGAVVGTYILSNIDGNKIKPFIGIYLLLMGIRILFKAINIHKHSDEKITKRRHFAFLGLVGGFLDAIGGGGWGPVVTATLVSDGKNPRKTIGSVNAAEFFVTVSTVITFTVFLTAFNWTAAFGLLIGGGVAAPLAALVTKKVPTKALMTMVGCLITFVSLRMIILSI